MTDDGVNDIIGDITRQPNGERFRKEFREFPGRCPSPDPSPAPPPVRVLPGGAVPPPRSVLRVENAILSAEIAASSSPMEHCYWVFGGALGTGFRMDDQTLLDELNALILKRIRGDAYIEYSSSVQRFRGSSLKELMDVRDRLQASIRAASGGDFALFAPLGE